MRPLVHLLSGLVLALLLFFFLPFVGVLGAVIIFLSSFLIDLDYLLYYFYKKKSWSLIKTYKYARAKGKSYKKLSRDKRKKYFRALRIFHGIETLIILFFLGYFVSYLFYYVLIGVLLHLVMDWIAEAKSKVRHDKFSAILSYFRFKKLKEIN